MQLPKHSAHVLALAGLLGILVVRPHAGSLSAPPPSTSVAALKVTTIAQTTRTLADQRIEFPLYRNQFTAVLMEIGAGGQTGRYQYLVPSFVYVLEGTLSVEVEGHDARTFSAGQTFSPGMNIWHNARNRTDGLVRILIIYVGDDEQRVNRSAADEAARQVSGPFDFVVGPFEP